MPNQLVAHYRASNPAESQHLSDDDITMLFASRAGDYAATGVDIFKEYPDFNSDYSRIKNSQVGDSITIGDRAKQAAGSAAGGFIKGVGGVFAKAPAVLTKKFTGGLIDPTDEASALIDSAVEKVTPDFGGDSEKKAVLSESFLNAKVPEAIGSAGSFMASGGVIGKAAKVAGVVAGGAEAGTVGTALSGAASSFSDAYDEALKKGATESQAFQSALLNGGVGLSEAVPLGDILAKISRVSPVGTKALLAKLAKTKLGQAAGEITTETLEEALQEAFQSGAGDIIAKDIALYDPNQELFKDTGENAAVGAASGFLLSLLGNSIHLSARKAASKGDGKQAPGPLPESETLKVTPAQPEAQDQTVADVAQGVYDIDAKGLNDLLQKEMEQGADAVAGEKASLSQDALRAYNIKLVEALREREAKRQAEPAPEVAAEVPVTEASAPAETPAAPTPAAETPAPAAEAPVETATPAAEVPAPVEAPVETPVEPPVESTPDAKIVGSAERFGNSHTWEDSLSHVSDDVAKADEVVTAYDEIGKLLSGAVERYASQEKKGPLLDESDIATLSGLDGEEVAALKIPVLLDKVKNNKASISDVSRTLKLAADLHSKALNRREKAKAKNSIQTADGKVSFDSILNPYSIDYVRNESTQGYTQPARFGDNSDFGQKFQALVDKYKASVTDEERAAAADALGGFLVTGSRANSKSSVTKKMVAWVAPDGSVIVTSAFDYSRLAKGNPKMGPNGKYRFTVGAYNRSAAKKGEEIASGKVGIETMLANGFRPLASIRTVSPRGAVAYKFGSVDEYAKRIGGQALTEQASVRQSISDFEKSGVVDIAPDGRDTVADTLAIHEAKDQIGKVKSDEGASDEESGGGEAMAWMAGNLDVLEQADAFINENPGVSPEKVAAKFMPTIVSRLAESGIPDDALAGISLQIESILIQYSNADVRERFNREREKLQEQIPEGLGESGSVSEDQKPRVGNDNADDRSGGGEGSQASPDVGQQEAEAGPSGTSGSPAESRAPASGSIIGEAGVASLEELKRKYISDILRLSDLGAIDADDAAQGIVDIQESEDDVDAQFNYLAIVTEARAVADNQKSDLDEDDIEVDENGESFRLIPNSEYAVRRNLGRLRQPPKAPVTTAGITGAISEEQIKATYPTLPDALKKIGSLETVQNQGGISPLSIIAQAMAENASLTGAHIKFINDPSVTATVLLPNGDTTTSPFAGKYNLATDEITVNLAYIRDIEDLHATILHEVVHVYIDRIDLRYDLDPASLSEEEKNAIKSIRDLAEVAKRSGVVWPGSDNPNARTAYREFYATALSDKAFQSELAKIQNPLPYQNKNLWEQFKELLSSLLSKAVRMFGGVGVRSEGTAYDESVLSAVTDAAQYLIRSRTEQTAFLDSRAGQLLARQFAPESKQTISYRIVEDMFGNGTDISVDKANEQLAITEAKLMMATTNSVEATFIKMMSVWKALNPNAPVTTTSAFVEDVIGRMFKGGVYTPEEIRTAIINALVDQGATTNVDPRTSLADLEQKGQLPKAAKDAYRILMKFEAELHRQVKIADRLFGKGAITQKIQQSNQDLQDLTNGYADITKAQKEFLKSTREALKEKNGSFGVYSVGKALGATNTEVTTALNDVASAIDTYTDALNAMAGLGFDYSQLQSGQLTPTQIEAAVNGSADPNLAPVKGNKARLAVLINFARRKPIAMDLLIVRGSKVERSAVEAIVKMAMSSKPDAFEEALSKLRNLTVLGKVGERILAQLKEHKKKNRLLLDTADRYAKLLEMSRATEPVLRGEIRKLEKILQLEGSAGGSSQWNAVDGATYYVPKDTTVADSELLADMDQRKKLRLGEHFDAKQVTADVMKIKEWLNANKGLSGTATYELLRKQADKLTWLYANNANYQIQRGPGGLIVQFLGDIATQAEWTGTHAGRVFAQQIRKYNTLYESHLKGPEQREFYAFDRMKREAMIATGLTSYEFDRRIYNQALNFLEHNKDIIDKNLSDQQQLEKSIKEAADHIASVDNAIDKPEARRAVVAFLKQAVVCNNITQKNRSSMGLKVKEKILGRWIFREPIGSPAHTMSRSVGWEIRSFVRSKMATPAAWESEVVNGSPKITASAISDLYKNNKPQLIAVVSARFGKEVMDKFVRPLCFKVGASNFSGPSVNGVSDMAQRDNVIDAYMQSGGDIIKFAETLFTLEGGTGDPAQFVGQTLATFQNYYSILRDVSKSMPDGQESLEESAVVSRSFLDAREGEDFPHEWLDYRQFGHVDNVRYTRMFALQAAYGQDAKGAAANLDNMISELTDLEAQYNAAMAETDPAIRNKLLNDGGLKRARMDARKNKVLAVRIKDNFRNLVATMNGVPFEETIFNRMTGMLAGYTVQGAATAFTDTVSMMETIFRKFGFSKEALSFIVGNYKNFGMELLGSLFQAMNIQLTFNSEWEQQTRLINMGLIDHDALTDKRLFGALGEKYKEMLGDDDTLSAVLRKTRGDKALRAKELARLTASSVAATLRVGLDTGIGVAKNPELSYPTAKIQAPFTWVNQLMHRAVARQWLHITMDVTRRATEYMRAHPQAAVDPTFRFSPNELQFSGRGLVGLSLDDTHFNYVNETLQRNGISLEEAARRGAAGQQALTDEQIHAIVSLAQTEILLNSSVATRPAWSINSPAGRLSSPIIGWSLYKMVDLVKTTRSPEGRAGLKAFKQATIAMLLGVVPASLAYALLRDLWDEEVLKKKSNVVPLALDRNLVPSLLDNLSRVGTFGIGGDLVNSMVNVSTSREFSLDSRIFFVNSLMNVTKVISTLYNQDGTATYDTVVRPLFQSLGGSGYLQNIDAINGLLGFDNSERRVIRRINVNNQLRSVGREMKLDVRTGRGMTAIPNPIKPWVGQMVLAAYANDPAGFQAAYTKAVEAATKQILKNPVPGADAKADVAEAFKRMHPLRLVFQKAPTQQEYQKLLVQLGDSSVEVAAAIRNFNSYGAQIPGGRGKGGIAPFTGTVREQQKGRTQSVITSDFGGDYRSITTRF